MFGLIDKLEKEECLEREEWITLLSAYGDEELRNYAAQKARTVAQAVFGTDMWNPPQQSGGRPLPVDEGGYSGML